MGDHHAIGGTCKRGNAFSVPVLIARGLDLEHLRLRPLWSFEGAPIGADHLDNFGGHSDGETPLPIPNREVKPVSADGTRRATSRESRSPPEAQREPRERLSAFQGCLKRSTGAVARATGRAPISARDAGIEPRLRAWLPRELGLDAPGEPTLHELTADADLDHRAQRLSGRPAGDEPGAADGPVRR